MKTRELSDNDLMRECLRESLFSFLRNMKEEGIDSDKVTRFLSTIIPLMKTITPDLNEERIKAIEFTLKDLMAFKALMVAKNQLKVFQGGGISTIGAT